jgi:sugar lactone lactonase YvrE
MFVRSLRNRSRDAAVLVLLLCASASFGQSIQTFAGGGTDDGRLATEIALFEPRGVAYDSAGNLYIVEQYSSLVRRVDAKTGTVKTIAGNGGAGFGGDGGPAKDSTLNYPSGIAIAGNGDIYIADMRNGRVRKIDGSTAVISTVAGRGSERPDGTLGDNGPAVDAVVRGPWSLWLDRGALYITEVGYLGQRVRKLVLSTGVITTIAGSLDGVEGYEGDGQAASKATFDIPLGVAVDSAGNVFVADAGNNRVRRIDATTGIIDTYAGGGNPADGVGDGGAATAAKLDSPTALTIDAAGNLLIACHDGVRRVDRSTKTISTIISPTTTIYGLTVDSNGNPIVSASGYEEVLRFTTSMTDFQVVAGGGSYLGDDLPARSAVLRSPTGLVLDGAGNLFIADSSHNRVRRVDAKSGIVTTYAGTGPSYNDFSEDGKPATSSPMYPFDVAIDPKGDLYIADPGNGRIKKVSAATGILTFYAGGGDPPGGNNEGLPATSAKLAFPVGVSFDAAGNLYIADYDANKIWRVDGTTKTISTFAGNGTGDFSGDGGQAAAASLSGPVHAVVDSNGVVYIADHRNGRIRRVGKDGVISTVAGGGTDSVFSTEHLAIDPRNNDLYVANDFSSRIMRIDAATGTITTFAGAGTAYYIDAGYQGDGGPATAALMNFTWDFSGLAISKSGDVYISDVHNNRVRSVLACTSVAAPVLQTPAGAATNVSTAPLLSWQEAAHAFRYDISLDTISPPARVAATDLSQTSFVPANLQPATKYYWRVTSKGDPFCVPGSSAVSAISSFTTTATCGVSAFAAIAPADAATGVAIPATLSWQAAAGAASYDVYLGTTNPPPLVATGVTSTSYLGNVPGGKFFWFVVARASCDPTKTASTDVRSFTTLSSTCVPGQISVALSLPGNLSTGNALTTNLSWTGTGAIEAYDVYFGASQNPPLLFANLTATTVTVSSLVPNTTYFWRVVARDPCDPSGVSSQTFSLTTRSCPAPGATTISFAPSSVSAGSTYSIVWSAAPGADADAGYLVERSTVSDFSSAVETQVTSSTAASFLAGATGTYFHRVRGVAGCDVTITGPVSGATPVNVTAARPNIVFTLQPPAVISSLGEHLEDLSSSFALENLGDTSLQVIVGRQELNGSSPFFNIADPSGGDAGFITLEPHQPRSFAVRFSGPRNDVAGSYQGVIFLASTGQGLTVTPYAFVNLKIGGTPSVAPQFIVAGAPADYVAFPAFAGDDSARLPIQIGVRNGGSSPVEVGFEIGPEVWLTTDATWNATQIPAGATRTVNLLTKRYRAPNGSPLPRYTYLTVRTRDGASSRLLVQDNDAVAVANGRSTRLGSLVRSFIVPEAASRTATDGSVIATRIRMSNVGSDAVQAELIYTPAGADGFDAAAVRRATIVVPPNDVVTVTDPLTQVLQLARPAAGQIEVRLPSERVGLVAVSATSIAIGGTGSYTVPVVNRGEGARLGSPQTLAGISKSTSLMTSVVLAETSGNDHAVVHAVLVTASGVTAGSVDIDIPRYGFVRYDDIAAAHGAPAIDNGHVAISVTAGGGSVIGMAVLHDPASNGGASAVSTPASGTSATSAVARILRRPVVDATPSVTIVVPVVPSSSSAGAAPKYQTVLGLTAGATRSVDFVLTFRGASTLTRTVTVPAGSTTVYHNVLGDVFSLPIATAGSLFVDAPSQSLVYGMLQAGASSPSSYLPLGTTVSEALTSVASSARPLVIDGVEQSTDPTRGTRWMLLLNETAGSSGSVNVLLYEAGNRSSPIAARTIAIAPYQQVQLDTVFGALGLDTPPRRKDRTNVECVVVASRGGARVAASAVSIDNVTGDTKVIGLTPVVGSGPPSVSLVSVVIPNTPPPAPGRRRTVHH